MDNTMTRTALVAANWKMNGSLSANRSWAEAYTAAARPACEVVVCAPAPYLPQIVELLAARADCGAQDLSEHRDGAYTGEVAAEMLAEVGARWVIVGHSERRQLHGETDVVVAAKVARALEAGLRPIVCVGETLAQRDSGSTEAVVGAQLEAVLARYPVLFEDAAWSADHSDSA